MASNEKRSCLRGLEGAIFDLLYTGAATGQWAEWLRVPLLHAAAVGDLQLVIKLQRAGANGSALHAALEGGQAALVRDLVNRGASVTGKDGNGDSPLHLASALGDEETVSFLLKKGALANALNGAGVAPLHVAVENGRLAAVSALLAAGADTSLRYGVLKDSALDSAAAKGHVEIVTALIRSGANVGATNSNDSTALHRAARNNEVGVINVLVDDRAVVGAEDVQGWTALHSAAFQGSSEAVLALLERGADFDKPALGVHGRTPLHVAAEKGRLASVNALLAAGADASLRVGARQMSALECAVTHGHVDVVRAFIKHGVDVNDADAAGLTALHGAAAKNNIAAIEVLVEAGAEVDAHGNGWTPFHEASSGGCSDALVALMRHGANKSKLDIKGRSPLHLAAGNGHIGAVNALLTAGADVNIGHGVDKISPLFAAASCGHVAVLRALIQNGAHIHGVDADRATAVHEAAYKNEGGAIDVLAEAGVSVDAAEDSREWTPLHCASDGRCFEATVALLKNGARVESKDCEGRSPLHWTVLQGHLPATEALLAAGASVHAMDDKGSTALHLAVGCGHLEVSRVLVQAGADVNATNHYGCTTLHDAVITTSDAGTVRMLIEAGAIVDALDASERTPLHRCASRDNGFDAIAVLLAFGANANAHDRSGKSPLHWAVSKFVGQDTVNDVDLLLRWGADETAINNDGNTPLEAAGYTFGDDDLGRLPDLLTRAPADRNWRRRGWLLLYRAYPRRMRSIPGTGAAVPSDRAKKCRARLLSTEAAGVASVVRGGAAGGVACGEGGAPGDWNGVVAWVMGMELEGVFRNVVQYL